MVKSIAITGGIGSGKSTISKMLSNLGYCVFDADIFAREVLFYPEIESRIKSIFGSYVFLEKGQLNRDLIRKMIFDDHSLKKKLESILHPAIEEEFNVKKQILASLSKSVWLFYETSLIIEIGKRKHFDACVVVTAKHESKFNRLNQSRNMSEEQFQKIISTQMTDEEKVKHADFVIENSGHLQDLEQSVLNLLQFLYKKFSPSSF